MREHSETELAGKLRARGFEHQAVNELIHQLRDQALLSDTRFAQAYASSRAAKGYGPAAIKQALRVRGVSDDVIASCLDGNDSEWEARLRSVKDKRFGPNAPSGPSERARQARFLVRRGFTTEQVQQALGGSRERTGPPKRPLEERVPAQSKRRPPRS